MSTYKLSQSHNWSSIARLKHVLQGMNPTIEALGIEVTQLEKL